MRKKFKLFSKKGLNFFITMILYYYGIQKIYTFIILLNINLKGVLNNERKNLF